MYLNFLNEMAINAEILTFNQGDRQNKSYFSSLLGSFRQNYGRPLTFITHELTTNLLTKTQITSNHVRWVLIRICQTVIANIGIYVVVKVISPNIIMRHKKPI